MAARNDQTTYKVLGGGNVTAGAGDTTYAVGTETTIVRMVGAQAFHWAYNRAATTSDPLCPAGVPEYFGVDGGDVLHFVQDSISGTVNVSEMSN